MHRKTTLRQAQRLILDLAQPSSPETVPLVNALGRIAARSAKSILPVPSFNSSTMDGFAINSKDILKTHPGRPVELEICGIIPAGLTNIRRLSHGKAFKIMTGGAVPPGSDLVLAQEDVDICTRSIKVARPTRAGTNIRKRGSELGAGRIIVRKGEIIDPEHLGLLATAGVNDLLVHQRPIVAVISTGSELIEPGREPETGRVISSNSLLLSGLAKQCGASVKKTSLIPDHSREIASELSTLLSEELPLILTTGGMGPGDFDLMAEVFKELRIKKAYSSLEVRPGRATMLGVSGKSLIMALPGPPPAVRLLFNELVQPAIRKIAGEAKPLGKTFIAELAGELKVRRGRILHLKAGVFSIKGSKIKVRQAKKTERANCVIILPPGKARFKAGERISIHPTLPVG